MIRENRAQHPECGFSTSESTSCRSVNGEKTCETVRQIWRVCPNRARTLVYSSKVSSDNLSRESPVDLFALMEELLRGFGGAILMKPHSNGFGTSTPAQPPHHEQQSQQQLERSRVPSEAPVVGGSTWV